MEVKLRKKIKFRNTALRTYKKVWKSTFFFHVVSQKKIKVKEGVSDVLEDTLKLMIMSGEQDETLTHETQVMKITKL